jgi:hypothetical protein
MFLMTTLFLLTLSLWLSSFFHSPILTLRRRRWRPRFSMDVNIHLNQFDIMLHDARTQATLMAVAMVNKNSATPQVFLFFLL